MCTPSRPRSPAGGWLGWLVLWPLSAATGRPAPRYSLIEKRRVPPAEAEERPGPPGRTQTHTHTRPRTHSGGVGRGNFTHARGADKAQRSAEAQPGGDRRELAAAAHRCQQRSREDASTYCSCTGWSATPPRTTRQRLCITVVCIAASLVGAVRRAVPCPCAGSLYSHLPALCKPCPAAASAARAGPADQRRARPTDSPGPAVPCTARALSLFGRPDDASPVAPPSPRRATACSAGTPLQAPPVTSAREGGN